MRKGHFVTVSTRADAPPWQFSSSWANTAFRPVWRPRPCAGMVHSKATEKPIFWPILPHWPRCARAHAAKSRRPRRCRFNWRVARTECAWRDRLRVRRWSATAGMSPGDCVSPQARWWAWARDGEPLPRPPVAGAPLAQCRRARAPKNASCCSSAPAAAMARDRMALAPVAARRHAPLAGRATGNCWRRAPTTATGRRASAPAPAKTLLLSVWADNLGGRAGEITGQQWRWQRAGCACAATRSGLGRRSFTCRIRSTMPGSNSAPRCNCNWRGGIRKRLADAISAGGRAGPGQGRRPVLRRMGGERRIERAVMDADQGRWPGSPAAHCCELAARVPGCGRAGRSDRRA